MGEIYFVRHGQASYGAEDYDRLSDLGHQQSDWLGQHLARTTSPFDLIVSGTLRRHRQTTHGVSKWLTSCDRVEDERLNEMSYFEMERAFLAQTKRPVPTRQEEMAGLFTEVINAWERHEIEGPRERFHHFQERIRAAFDEYARKGVRVLMISSGGPLGIVMRHVLNLDITATAHVMLATNNASFSRFRFREGAPMLVQFNGIPHLEAPERHHAQTYL